MLRLVIFDFDGVLADSERAHYEMFRIVLEQEGIDFSWQSYCEKYLGYTDIECFAHILEDLQLDSSPERVSALAKRKSVEFRHYIEKNSLIFPGVRELLTELSKHQIFCAICSGALKAEVELMLKSGQLEHFFELIVAAEDVKLGKPDPQGYLMSLDRMNQRLKGNNPISDQQCVVIEDSTWGIQAAKAANMRCVAVETSYPANQLQGADRVVKSMTEIDLALLQQVTP